MKAYIGCLLLLLPLKSWTGQAPMGPPPAEAPLLRVFVTANFPGTAFAMPTIPGEAYSARQVIQHTQTLADGTHITQPARMELLYRDSAGRSRTERPLGPPELAGQYVIAQIRDPIAQVQYALDPVNKVAHRVAMRPAESESHTLPDSVSAPGRAFSSAPPAALARGASSNGSSRSPIEKEEDMGTQVIEGLVVQGTKFTTTVPAGAEGNDEPLITVREQWLARDSGLTVLSHLLDPENGETVIKLTEISTTEPDPSLFVPPPDYAVVEETGAFQINFHAQSKEKQ